MAKDILAIVRENRHLREVNADLLAACEDALRSIEALDKHFNLSNVRSESPLYDKIEAAIAKAKGEK